MIDVAEKGSAEPDVVVVKSYNSKKRWPKFLVYFLFVALMCFALLIFLGLYLQWYDTQCLFLLA